MQFNGLFNFQGLIIVRGEQQKLVGTTNKVLGAMLVGESMSASGGQDGLTITGNLTVAYSSQVLNTYVLNKWSNAFSTNARIIAWNELM